MTPLSDPQPLIDYLAGFITPRRLKRMREVLEGRTRYITVVLEDIFQPQNASAVLRSCECFGVQDVHIIENRNAFEVNPEVALGASKWLSLHHYREGGENTQTCLRQLKNKGYRLVATSPHRDDCLLEELPLDQKTALLFGTELQGLSQAALDRADGFVRIPMRGFTESFNISVSVAICLYHLSRRLREDGADWPLPGGEKQALMLEWMKKSVRHSDQLIGRFPGFS